MIVRELLAGVGTVRDGGGVKPGKGDDQDGKGDEDFHGRYLLLGY
jgi:hypothetical protein